MSISLKSSPTKSLNLRGPTIFMSSCLCRYDHIDDALCSRIIHFIFNEGFSYADTNERYNYLYKTIKSIAKTFEANGQLVPKHRGGVCYPSLQDEHIQWLVERLHVDPDNTIESLHR